jgi:hypothetical protein
MDEVIQGTGFTVRASKFDFFFGRVTSDPEFYPGGNLDTIPQITSIIPMIYEEETP